jgi:threonine synthase
MTTIDQTAKLDLDSFWLKKMQEKFDSVRVTDEEMCESMRKVRDKFNYFADPHICVALAGDEKLGYSLDIEHLAVPTALLATASPCKFEESVTAALGEEGRNEFKEKFLPAKAAEFMAKDEVPPFVYTRASTGNHWPKSKSVGKLKHASL